MRNAVLFLIIGMIIFAGCKKDNPMPTEEEIKKKREEIWREIETSSNKQDSTNIEESDTLPQTSEKTTKNQDPTNVSLHQTANNPQQISVQSKTNEEEINLKTKTYKVQVFSATKKEYAQKIANEINEKLKINSAHVEKKRNFYRVIIGPFDTRQEADKIRRKCAENGYKDAYILQSSTGSAKKEKITKPISTIITPNIKDFFTIQIGSFSSLSNAEKYRKEANKKLNKETFIIKEGKLYKVFVGKYKTHKEAENAMREVVKEYKDAFIIKK